MKKRKRKSGVKGRAVKGKTVSKRAGFKGKKSNGRAPSGKSKHSKVAKLKRLALSPKKKKKGFWG